MSDDPADEVNEGAAEPPGGTEPEHTEYHTLAQGFLSPRHRRLAQLAAEGKSNAVIAEELGYVGSRVSILLRNPHIALEIRRLQDRIFEETIAGRLKSFAEPALNNIHMILTDQTNRVKISEKAEMSKWVVEKLDGKATQKLDVGENLLGVLLDRLDGQRVLKAQDVQMLPQGERASAKAGPKEEPPDELEMWVKELEVRG